MDQPLFSCTKCFRNFPESEMSKSKQACKSCNPTNSSFKQCSYCKADFKHYICSTLREKHGEPKPCTICTLSMAFGNALVCQRCLHYRTKFGDPAICESCHKQSAFVKDIESRAKVDNKTLCWVCTYNYKLARTKEPSNGVNKQKHRSSHIDASRTKSSGHRHQRSGYSSSRRSDQPTQEAKTEAKENTLATYSLDSAYNEHLLKISQMQDEIKSLNAQLEVKRQELIKKDTIIAGLRSEIYDVERSHKERIEKLNHEASAKQDQLMETLRKLQKEKLSAQQAMKKRRSQQSLGTVSNPFEILKPLQVPPKAALTVSQSMSNLNPNSPTPQSAAQQPPSPHNSVEEQEDTENEKPSKKPRFKLDSSSEEEEETSSQPPAAPAAQVPETNLSDSKPEQAVIE